MAKPLIGAAAPDDTSPAPMSDDMPTGEGTWSTVATVESDGAGRYRLVPGDAAAAREDGEEAPSGQEFDGPGALLNALLDLLEPTTGEGADAAEGAAFSTAFKGQDKAASY